MSPTHDEITADIRRLDEALERLIAQTKKVDEILARAQELLKGRNA